MTVIPNYPKRIKKLLREYMIEAYEMELYRELGKLEPSFAEWRNGEISSGELSYRIHKYETGPSQKLFKHYNHGPVDMSVAYAIVVGILEREQMPDELLEAIAGPLDFYESLKAANELKEPD